MKLTGWVWCLFVLGLVLAGTERSQAQDIDDELDVEEGLDEEDVGEEVPAPSEPEEVKERPVYSTPEPKGFTYFVDTFDDSAIGQKWILSQAKKDDTDENIAKYNGKWTIEEPTDSPLQGDQGLVLGSRAKHHAISAPMDTTFEFNQKPFIVQYEVKFQNGQECGGAYVKLLTQDNKFEPKFFQDKSPYTIMFGPDKCGNDNKLHFIFRHKNPITGQFEEKHAKKPSGELTSYFTDKKTHVYTLVLTPENTFEIFVDMVLVNSGSLLEDFEPPVNPPKEITDPNDKKPADWDEREKIKDPEATKPEDWDEDAPEMIDDEDAVKPDGWLDDEAELIPDPDAEKPSDWDDDMDGEWEPPQISNPKCEDAPGCGEWKRPTIKNPAYKGKWSAPMIDNPSYKGKWKPRKIPNPDYFEDSDPFSTMTSIGALGLELWSMSDGIYFDNFIITDDKAVSDQWAAESWELKSAQETSGGLSGKSVVQAVMDVTKDRPWLWAVFILVIVLPIVLVVAYCCMSGPSKAVDSTKDWFMGLIRAAEERHWLWAVYAMVILIPITILSMICCPKRGPGVRQPDDPKKTDEPQPDDQADEQEGEESGGSGDAKPADKKNTDKKKSSKGALEADELPDVSIFDESFSEPDLDLDGFESYQTTSSSSSSFTDLELSGGTIKADEADAEDEDDKPAEKATPTRSSPRKRKPKAQKE